MDRYCSWMGHFLRMRSMSRRADRIDSFPQITKDAIAFRPHLLREINGGIEKQEFAANS
jgi:hypothetical protein